MPTLDVINPATGKKIASLPADDARSARRKFESARVVQPLWSDTPLRDRIAVIRRFRAGIMAELDVLAATLTSETGKPITQARNEINGLLTRLDFFNAEAP